MQAFRRLSGIAAPLPMMNVDTDMIIPKQFLKTIKRAGLGQGLFYELRFDLAGRVNPDFVLNRPPFDRAVILVSGANFGCGSSREHAPWALLDFGIRCIIAPSFADIFFNNCFKNGILPVVLEREDVDVAMAAAAAGETFTVDLLQERVILADGRTFSFTVDPFQKACLMDGLDEIGLTLQKAPAIEAFEARQRAACPWLYT
jgi:3-isopropylmalate/(R)-2-methylmalate dehydratase small subunit